MTDSIEYRALLLKYITYVGEMEGTDFIRAFDLLRSSIQWTDAELVELLRISAQSDGYEADEAEKYVGDEVRRAAELGRVIDVAAVACCEEQGAT